MARVTVEDCLLAVPSRFTLVALAAQRAKDIASGGSITIDRDNDKDPVVALREIAKGTVKVEALQESLVRSFQKRGKTDDAEVENEGFSVSEADAQEIAADMRATAPSDDDKAFPEGFSFAEENIESED